LDCNGEQPKEPKLYTEVNIEGWMCESEKGKSRRNFKVSEAVQGYLFRGSLG
jgi:hypothetical protein